MLLGSRGLFPDNGRWGEAKQALTSKKTIWIVKRNSAAMSSSLITFLTYISFVMFLSISTIAIGSPVCSFFTVHTFRSFLLTNSSNQDYIPSLDYSILQNKPICNVHPPLQIKIPRHITHYKCSFVSQTQPSPHYYLMWAEQTYRWLAHTKFLVRLAASSLSVCTAHYTGCTIYTSLKT